MSEPDDNDELRIVTGDKTFQSKQADEIRRRVLGIHTDEDGVERAHLVQLTPDGLTGLLDALRPAVEKANAENEGQHERAGDGWEGHLEGQVPVQGYGFVDGYHWYFRARYDAWSFSVGNTEDAAIDGTLFEVTGDYGEPGGYEAGWMPYAEAWALIEKAIAAFRSRK